jgi:hypothetical protein
VRGELAIERFTLPQQPLEIPLGADQRPVVVGFDPGRQHLDRHLEEHAGSGAPQRDAVRRLEHNPAAARDHRRVVHRGIDQGLRLARAEPGLAFRREDLRHRPTGRLFDLVVEVDERHAELARELTTDRGLPRAGHPDEVHDHGSSSR